MSPIFKRLLGVAFGVALLSPAVVLAQTPLSPAFTYQGRVERDGVPMNGTVDLGFVLWTAESGGSILGADAFAGTLVNDGLFTVTLNQNNEFGASPFDGSERWLQVVVNGVNVGTRQRIAPTPYAVRALRAAFADNAAQADTATSASTAQHAATATSALSVEGIDGHSLNGASSGPVDAVYVDSQGRTGFGTTSPKQRIQNVGDYYGRGHLWLHAFEGDGVNGTAYLQARDETVTSHIGMVLRTKAGGTLNSAINISPNGNVGIGTPSLGYPLEVTDSGNCEMVLRSSDGGGNAWNLVSAGVQGFPEDHAFQIVDRDINVSRLTILKNSGMVVVKSLQILGGADLAEPFEINDAITAEKTESAESAKPGFVVSIDANNPGELRICDRAFDTRVAGIISGAGGVAPGLILKQEDSIADGKHPVALSGRVYCWVDADAGGPVKPGDLLTTSSTAGHAMRLGEQSAPGAIIGKAMTSLDSGKGLVLVLVNLH